MEYSRPGDRIKIDDPFTRRRLFRSLIREGFEVKLEGKEIVIISDRLGVRKNH